MHNPTRRMFLRRAGQGAIAAMAGPWWQAARAAEKAGKKWNFVFILADDLGWPDPVCYGKTVKGSTRADVYETPNIDRLASRGIRFTDAYAACPVCSPTRASIMTGQYPARIGLTEWIPGKGSSPREKVVAPKYLHYLPNDLVTIAEALKPAGYVCGHVGKWHLGGKGHLPEDQGFDSNVGGTQAGSPAGGYFLPNKMKLPGATKGDYLTDRLTEEGLKFIEAHKDKPFFLYQSYHSVHTPIQAKKDYVQKYQAKLKALGKRANATYAGMVASLDDGVGRITAKLDELGIADRTVVFFMSDNGGLSGVTNNAPLRAGKGYVYEGGIREPMIIRVPGLTKAGRTCAEPVISVDFYPTILDLAGAKGDSRHVVDGVSLVPLLRGEKTLGRKAMYWHYPHYSPQGGRPGGCVRAGNFKLVELYDDNSVELYDLSKDIGERTNLVETSPEKTAELHAMLKAWRKEVGALMPKPNPRYDPKAGRGRPSRGKPAPQKVTPGAKDKEFDVLRGAGVDADRLGYAVRGHSTGGVALKKLAKPVSGVVELRAKVQSRQADKSDRAWRNGFLVFGDGAEDGKLVCAGLYLGGRRMVSIVEGGVNASKHRKEASLSAGPYTEFDVHVTLDTKAQTVRLSAGGQAVTLKLSRPLEAVTHVGYAVVNTTTAFSEVQVRAK